MRITRDVRLIIGAVVVALGTLAVQAEVSWRTVLVSLVAGLGTLTTEGATRAQDVAS